MSQIADKIYMNAKIYSVANELQKMITELFIDALNVHLKLLDIRKLKPYAEEILHTLPEERRQKALNYCKEEDKMRSIGSSFLIMQTVSWQKVYYGKYGKPLAHGKNFNVSHSGNYVVLAESKNSIGVDIEELRDDITSDLIDAGLTKREKELERKLLYTFLHFVDANGIFEKILNDLADFQDVSIDSTIIKVHQDAEKN